jgi:hypothetical protein
MNPDEEKSCMIVRFRQLASFLAVLLLATAALAGGKAQSFTGTVSDAMCGAHHMMSGPEADCTRACVGKGSKYALVVGDKLYFLNTSDKATLASIDKLAGTQAKVSGTLDGETIQVASVAAAK